MAFVLQGEINIDGRKGTVVLKDIQREAEKTSKSFDKVGGSATKLAAVLLKTNATTAHLAHSLSTLGKFGLATAIGVEASRAINKFGEAVRKSATDYYSTQKSLADAFEQGFKSKNVDEAANALDKTKGIVEDLKLKLTGMGQMGKFLEGLEGLTGLNIFGVSDTKKSLEQAKQNIDALEKIVELRKKEKERIDAVQEATNYEAFIRNSASETLKLKDKIYKRNSNNVKILENEAANAKDAVDENDKILSILREQNQTNRNQEEIEKRIIEGRKLRLNLIKAENAVAVEQQAKTAQVLAGSKAGRASQSAAEKKKQKQEKDKAFKEEEAAVKQRQQQENADRSKRGLPLLNMQDVRNRMAEEAAGIEPKKRASISTEGVGFSENMMEEYQQRKAQAIKRQNARPTDSNERVNQYKAREAQKVMEETAKVNKENPYKKTIIRGGGGSTSSSDPLLRAIQTLNDKIPVAFPV